jgi:hypothetical protein
MTKDEALAFDLALNALLWANNEINDWRHDAHGYKPEDHPQITKAITAIKQALAAPVQEPVAKDNSNYRLDPPGLDLADGTQVSKVWWDGEKLMAKPIPLVDFYQPVQDSTCNETLRAQGKAYPRTCRKCGLGPCIGAPKQPPAVQRQWVGLTQDEFRDFATTFEYGTGGLIRAIEAKLKDKNNG